MLQVSEIELKKRLGLDNPWWESGSILALYRDYPQRAYLPGLMKLIDADVRRAVVLMGPRRVGKTVMVYQAIQQLLDRGVAKDSIFYVSVDTPVYVGLTLEKLLNWFMEVHGHGRDARLHVFYDEVQYLKDWERHLKSLVDAYPAIRFVVSGSAAAALKMKSDESGAGRFTDFLLPPLSFYEFMTFSGVKETSEFYELSIEAQEAAFIDYINYGGFPEAVVNKDVRAGMERYVADDIIDKVLLRDLPGLYGIDDTQDLKRLFSVLAYNTGQEINLEKLSQGVGIAKNTIKKYLDYLEAAFLIHRIERVDQNAHRLKRSTHFKVYLTNPSLRTAMFGSASADDTAMGALAETAYLAQLLPYDFIENCYYARWKTSRGDREIDFVWLNPNTQKPYALEEIRWSKSAMSFNPGEFAGLLGFPVSEGLQAIACYCRDSSGSREYGPTTVEFLPLMDICFVSGKPGDGGILDRRRRLARHDDDKT